MIKKALAAVVGVLIFAAIQFNLDHSIWYLFHDWTVDKNLREQAVWLSDYQVDVDGKPMRGIEENASGITYNHDEGSLWVVTNRPTALYELDGELNAKRKVDLKNFADTESIVYVGNRQFIVGDEKSQTIAAFKLSKDTTLVDLSDLKRLSINLDGHGNKGLEGIAHDPQTNDIYVVRERDPRRLMKINGFIQDSGAIDIEQPDKIDVDSLYLDDLSGLHFDPGSNNLLFLSDESKLLVEVSLKGEKVSYLNLERGFKGLITSVRQAEGVALDAHRDLYIISEPNLIYRFKKALKGQ